MEQPVLNHFKLKLTYGADYFPTIELIGKHLSYTFVHQLTDTFIELLGLHGVGIFYIFEHLGGEGGKAFEVKVFAGGEGVADFEVAVIGETYNIAGEGFVYDILLLGHEGCGRGKAQ